MDNKQKSKINYFTTDEGKKNAIYKLWCAWLPQYQSKWQGRKTTVWFGLNKRRGNGLDWLLNKAKGLRHEFIVAHIYDNQTGKLLYTVPGSDLEALNQLQTETTHIYDNQTGKLLYTVPGSDLEALNQLQTETTNENTTNY